MADPFTAALVSGLVKLVIDKLATAVIEEFSQVHGVKSQLRKLKSTMDSIAAVLQDAEEKQYKDRSIKLWLDRLKEVVYDIDDLLDWFSTENLKEKVRPWQPFTDLYNRHRWAKSLESICRQLDTIDEEKSRYKLDGCIPADNSADQRETSSHIVESNIYGREQDKEWIVSRLVTFSTLENDKFLVIPIIGMGGIGKSTLAQLVFNDPRGVRLFSWRFWVYVSRNFVLNTVIGKIIKSVTGQDCSNWNLQDLQNKLHEILAEQTFLLVLDDVWIEDQVQWEKLRDFLIVCSRGAIIVTTRGERVASITGTIKSYKVKRLGLDHCWSVFARYAFEKGEEKAYPELVKSGRSIVEKCKGVPLAVKALGSSLRHKRDFASWKNIEDSELWKIDQELNVILPALKLSFDQLPSHLKSCFAYCAIFGKGYPIDRVDIVNMWVAQGLLSYQDGDKCFDELFSMSFFQLPGYNMIERYVMSEARHYEGGEYWDDLAQSFKRNTVDNLDPIIKTFTSYEGRLDLVEMHDLMQDLAAYVAGEEIANVNSNIREISEKARHIVWDKEDLSGKEFPKALMRSSKARSSAFFPPMPSLSKSFLESFLSSFKCLRVLKLCEMEFEVLPDLIGDLKHLRYLDVSRNPTLKVLPTAICKLVNLQVLDLGYCYELLKLPKNIHQLVSLRVLIVTSKASCFPERGFHCWNSLRTLMIFKCPNLTLLPEGMGNLKSLRVFQVWFCSSLASLPNDMIQLINLEELHITKCKKLDLAQWDGLNGLQNLKLLHLERLPKLISIPCGFENVGRSLRHLMIYNCEALISLPEGLEHCTSLLYLELGRCFELNKLHDGVKDLVRLQELRIIDCSILSKRCERDIGDDWPLIAHIPYIEIDSQVIQNKVLSTQE